MIISKLLLIIVMLVLCRMLQAECFKIQCTNTVVTAADNLYHACKSFPRLGKEEIPKLLQKGEFRLSLVWIFFSVEKTKLLHLHRTEQDSSYWDMNWLQGPHRAMVLAPGEPQLFQDRWQPWKLKQLVEISSLARVSANTLRAVYFLSIPSSSPVVSEHLLLAGEHLRGIKLPCTNHCPQDLCCVQIMAQTEFPFPQGGKGSPSYQNSQQD